MLLFFKSSGTFFLLRQCPVLELIDSVIFSKKNWLGAMEYCKKNDMYLLSLESEKESQLVTNYIQQSGSLINSMALL